MIPWTAFHPMLLFHSIRLLQRLWSANITTRHWIDDKSTQSAFLRKQNLTQHGKKEEEPSLQRKKITIPLNGLSAHRTNVSLPPRSHTKNRNTTLKAVIKSTWKLIFSTNRQKKTALLRNLKRTTFLFEMRLTFFVQFLVSVTLTEQRKLF